MFRGIVAAHTLSPKNFLSSAVTCCARRSPLIQHGQNHTFDLKHGVQGHADPLDRVQQLADAFQRKVFRLHRNQN